MNPSKPTPTFSDTLWTVGEETFESLAFMLPMPEDEDPAADGWAHVCRVEFTGPFGGTVFVAISPGMLDPLAANMLGIESGDDTPEGVQKEDAIKELLNVVCGNLLPAIAGSQEVFHIASPTLLDEPVVPQKIDGLEQRGRAKMTLDSGRAMLVLFVDAGAVIRTPSPEPPTRPAEPGGY
ncbi:MAG: hypothetical protein GVY16_07295 [Planctomycetes bacterium]|jgi:hypothetical protein|nr:chemotaxis protein CheX [Phycisphaerae bacterium]NBB95531.1 hypothetical protein [Planctomycetota bacterium]